MFKLVIWLLEGAGKKYMNLIVIFLVIGGFGYLDTTKVDKDTLQVLIESNLKQQAEVALALGKIDGEMEGLALYLTGKKSFNSHKTEKWPPQVYILDCDSCTDRIPAGGYDSCKVGIITDTSMTRVPWYCYYGESDIAEFR